MYSRAKIRVTVLMLLPCVFGACDRANPVVKNDVKDRAGKLAQISWLVGTWSNSGKGRRDFEAWEKQDDATYRGKSYSLLGGDTVSSESIELVERPDGIFYIPTVKGQNDNLPVSFRLVALDSNRIVFENEEHDFPQQVSYHLISRDSLVAEISGVVKGEYRARQFPMRRTE